MIWLPFAPPISAGYGKRHGIIFWLSAFSPAVPGNILCIPFCVVTVHGRSSSFSVRLPSIALLAVAEPLVPSFMNQLAKNLPSFC